MRTNLPSHIERGRVRRGRLGSDSSVSPCGFYFVQHPNGATLKIMASDGSPEIPWEHVSVSTEVRCPTWEEMDWVKRQFWKDDECVMQLHVPRELHINRNEFCLHLWKPIHSEIPLPPPVAV